jgi:hypothetical protein
MRFTNIGMFHSRMQRNNVTIAFFTIQYRNCALECAYSRIQQKFLIAFVDHNIGFTCSLAGDYTNGYINHEEAVEQLMRCRNHNRYDPIHFYEFLNNQLPIVEFERLNQSQYHRTILKAVSNFEDRIYFNHWRNANISAEQREKTVELMGYEVVGFCEENHLTPVFYPYPTQRTLDAFDNFELDYRRHGRLAD